MSTKKPGRKTKKEEESVQDKLAKCFGDGLSAPAAARIVGVDRKTAFFIRYWLHRTSFYNLSHY